MMNHRLHDSLRFGVSEKYTAPGPLQKSGNIVRWLIEANIANFEANILFM